MHLLESEKHILFLCDIISNPIVDIQKLLFEGGNSREEVFYRHVLITQALKQIPPPVMVGKEEGIVY